jgi:flagellar biogenesis protein FliO
MAARLTLLLATHLACNAPASAGSAERPETTPSAAALHDPWTEVQLQIPSTEDKPLARSSAGASRQMIPRAASSATATTSWVRSTASLAGVLALIVLLAWGYRRAASAGRLTLGGRARRPGLIEVISRTPLSARQSLCLVRVGPRMVLIGLSGDQLSSLDVIDDADLTARLAGEQRSRDQARAGAAFGKLLHAESAGYEPEPALEEAAPEAARLSDVRAQLSKTIQRIRRASSTANGVLAEAAQERARVAT